MAFLISHSATLLPLLQLALLLLAMCRYCCRLQRINPLIRALLSRTTLLAIRHSIGGTTGTVAVPSTTSSMVKYIPIYPTGNSSSTICPNGTSPVSLSFLSTSGSSTEDKSLVSGTPPLTFCRKCYFNHGCRRNGSVSPDSSSAMTTHDHRSLLLRFE